MENKGGIALTAAQGARLDWNPQQTRPFQYTKRQQDEAKRGKLSLVARPRRGRQRQGLWRYSSCQQQKSRGRPCLVKSAGERPWRSRRNSWTAFS